MNRRSSLCVIGLSALLQGLLVIPSRRAGADDRDRGYDMESRRIQIGFRITPVPLNLWGRDRALVGLGSYIVNAQSACNDCHTNPPYAAGGDPFKGEPTRVNSAHFLAGGTAFGPVVSPNITPAPGTHKPAGLTYAQFRDLMRTGRDPDDPSKLLQVMPWPVYGQMTDHDLRAIYEYLSAIPHAEPGP